MKIQTQSSKPKLSKTVKDILLSLQQTDAVVIKNNLQEIILEKPVKELLDPKSDFRMFHNFVLQNYVQSAEKEDGKIVLTARPPKMTQIVQDADSEAKINI